MILGKNPCLCGEVVNMECENIPKFANHGRERSSDPSNTGERSQAGETYNLAPFDDFMRRLELVIIGALERCNKSARRCAIIMRAVVMPACGLGTQDLSSRSLHPRPSRVVMPACGLGTQDVYGLVSSIARFR